MSETRAMLEVQALSRWYDGGAVQALHEVSFDAHAGQTVALTGPSGCGKSTLLSLIGLLDRPTQGRILVDGQDLASVRRAHAFRAPGAAFLVTAALQRRQHVLAELRCLGEDRVDQVGREILAAGKRGEERGKIEQFVADETHIAQRGLVGQHGETPERKIDGPDASRGVPEGPLHGR